MYRIDLNCDLGESLGAYEFGRDQEVIPLINSANVACGFHAGDPTVMTRTVAEAIRHGVGIGAHPSYRDLAGFGRRVLLCSEDEVYGDVLYQIGALYAFARAQGTALSHVKPHGALNNRSFKDAVTARGIVRAVKAFDSSLPIFAMPGSALLAEAEAAGLPVVHEVFADRAYNPDGSLVDRRLPGAVIHTAEEAAARVVRMVVDGKVTAADGTEVSIRADSACVHGDNPAAVELIRTIRERLQEAGIVVTRATVGRHGG